MDFFKELESEFVQYARAFLAFVVFLFLLYILVQPAHGLNIRMTSDTLSTSRLATSSDHTVRFEVLNTIPPSGQIIITPENGEFAIPAGFDFVEVDLATSSALGGPYADRSIAAAADASNDGVSVTTGTSGAVTITLNSTQGIPPNSFVEIELGSNATFGASGFDQWLNPNATTSYRVDVETRNASGSIIGSSATRVAITRAFTVRAEQAVDDTPPVRSSGSPSGALPGGIVSVELSLDTNEVSGCRYATATGVAYSLMPNGFNVDVTGAFHFVNVLNLAVASHTFNVRCIDLSNNTNTDDFAISFETFPPPPPPGPPSPGPGGSGGGTGSGAGGFTPFPRPPAAPEVTFIGHAYPFATVSILQDGEQKRQVTAMSDGSFSVKLDGLSQGTFTFGVVGQDTGGRTSIVFTITLTLVSGGKNTVSNIFLHPTYEFENDTLELGEGLMSFGQSIPNSTMEIWLYPQDQQIVDEDTVIIEAATSDETGNWSNAFDTTGLARDTYAFKARAGKDGVGTSAFGPLLYFGVGEEPTPDFCVRSDINSDTRVNLVDFSILLFNWNTNDPFSDINLDGTVSLTDFSIMLFCWTG